MEGVKRERGIDTVTESLLKSTVKAARPSTGRSSSRRSRSRSRSDVRSRRTAASLRRESPTRSTRSRGGASASSLPSTRIYVKTPSMHAESVTTPPAKPAKEKKDSGEKQYGMGAAFPIRKDALIKEVQDAVNMIPASRVGNYAAMLQKPTQELARRQGDESDCPHDSTALQDEITELTATGDTLVEKAKKLQGGHGRQHGGGNPKVRGQDPHPRRQG